MSTKPYTYYLRWTDLGIHYYGVRYANNCSPNDLWNPYKTSSKYVRMFIKENGDPDIIEIRKIFRSKKKALKWEKEVLHRLNAAANNQFLNQTNAGSFVLTDKMIEKIRATVIDKWASNNQYKEIHHKSMLGANNVATGTIWIHDKKGNHKRIKPEKINDYQGWIVGRIISEEQKKIMKETRKIVNDPKTGRFIKTKKECVSL